MTYINSVRTSQKTQSISVLQSGTQTTRPQRRLMSQWISESNLSYCICFSVETYNSGTARQNILIPLERKFVRRFSGALQKSCRRPYSLTALFCLLLFIMPYELSGLRSFSVHYIRTVIFSCISKYLWT
jgi:hypothetical protein